MPETTGPSRDIPEDELIELARSGDDQAFGRLVTHYQDYLYRLMVRACHHPQDAEEVASEAFARAHERLQQFEGRSKFISWIGRIATNLCFRRREKKSLPSVPLMDQARMPAARGLSPDQELMRAEMKSHILSAVAELEEPDRTILRLRDIDQLSTARVMQQTGLSEGAVKSRLHRARKRLRDSLNNCFLSTID